MLITRETTSLKAVEEPMFMRTRRQEFMVEMAMAVRGMEVRASTWEGWSVRVSFALWGVRLLWRCRSLRTSGWTYLA